MMKLVSMILIAILIIGLFTFVYTFVLIQNDYGVMDYDEYYGIGEYNQTPCKAEYLGEGVTRLSNCAEYKINQDKLQRSNRVR